MNTVDEIKEALRELSRIERANIAAWLDIDPYIHRVVAEPAFTYGEPEKEFMTVDEYLEGELTAEIRSEFIAGVIHPMCGTSVRHQRILTNLQLAIYTHLKGGPCKPYTESFKLNTRRGPETIFYYPDLMVDCGDKELSDYFLTEPKLIIEVLSPGTERIDRNEKAPVYQQIATVEEYVMVSQKRPFVEIQRRSRDWQPEVWQSMDDRVEFNSIALSMSLRQIYEDVPNLRSVTS